MEVVNHHAGLEVASPQQQQYGNTSPQPTYSKQYYPQAATPSPSYFSPPLAPSHAASHAPPSHAPTDVWDGKKRTGRSWLLPAAIAAAVAAIIVGGAVGGGLGASLSSCQANLRSSDASLNALQSQSNGCATPSTGSPTTASNPSTASTTSGMLSNYVVPAPDKVLTLDVDCDSLAKFTQGTWQSQFSVTCGIDVGSGTRTNTDNQQVQVADVGALVAYSFQHCIDACSGYTRMNARSTGLKCESVGFRWDLANWAKNPDHSNCWLKNSTVSPEGFAPKPKDMVLFANVL